MILVEKKADLTIGSIYGSGGYTGRELDILTNVLINHAERKGHGFLGIMCCKLQINYLGLYQI